MAAMAIFVFTRVLVSDDPNKYLEFQAFTYDSNLLFLTAALLTIVFDIISLIKANKKLPTWVVIYKYIATTAVTVTFVTVLVLLWPATQDAGWAYGGNNFFLHLLIPVIAIIDFIFFESETKINWKVIFFSLSSTLIYGIFYIIFVKLNIMEDMYQMLQNGRQYYMPIAMIAGTLLIGFLLWLFQKIMRLIFFGYDSNGKDDIVETTNNKSNNVARAYHISRYKMSKKWQVKLANGNKIIKIFDTQAEAIQYAKDLVKTQGGSIRIHSIHGQLRKNN
jgi:hypothetical protein